MDTVDDNKSFSSTTFPLEDKVYDDEVEVLSNLIQEYVKNIRDFIASSNLGKVSIFYAYLLHYFTVCFDTASETEL